MAAKPSKGPVTFEEFKYMLVDILQVDEEKVIPDASFVSDLMVDSIKLVELMLGLEENGINIPIEAAWDVQTVGDAYRVYKESMTGGNQQLATSG
jgi:acyl carrier protein